MYRTHNTQHGTFNDPTEYKNHLISLGYTDLGWCNGWNVEQNKAWVKYKDNMLPSEQLDDHQWNNTGSHCTYTIHSAKVFCSVDMGD